MADRVDFYVLAADTPAERIAFACRLAEKAYKLGNSVRIRLDNSASLSAMDQQLWLFRPESFVPHQVQDANSASVTLPGVTLALAEDQKLACDLLINLAEVSVEQTASAQRVAEIVIQHPQVLEVTRQAYACYKGLQLSLQTHKLS